MRVHRYRPLGWKFGITAERSPIGTRVDDPRPRVSWSLSLFLGRRELAVQHTEIRPVKP